jgi:hypothetical protein
MSVYFFGAREIADHGCVARCTFLCLETVPLRQLLARCSIIDRGGLPRSENVALLVHDNILQILASHALGARVLLPSEATGDRILRGVELLQLLRDLLLVLEGLTASLW